MAALFGTKPKPRTIGNLLARRLDFFEIDPALRGGELGPLALAAFGRLVLDNQEAALLVPALPAVVQWYLDLGAERDPPWRTVRELVPLWFNFAKLSALAEFADAFED